MNNKERTIYIALKVLLGDAGANKENINKKWLKAAAALLYFALKHNVQVFREVWLDALSVMPSSIEFDYDMATDLDSLGLLHEVTNSLSF